jgi:hypothetical protein
MDRLIKILSHRRPAGSTSEAFVIKEVITDKYPHTLMNGNVVIKVGESATLFSCHTDTVHSKPGVQRLVYDENFESVHLDNAPLVKPLVDSHSQLAVFGTYDRDCLGADDGAGMYLLLEMIDANVPGTYVFHHSEEIGGLGSRSLSFNTEFLGRFKRAVAFDRKGTGDIIDHQRGGRCCSDVFVKALSAQLKEQGLTYAAATGSFTDTANYRDTIPECTNLSCGYYNEHGPSEWLDVAHLHALRDAVVKIDWESLPSVRDPKEIYIPPIYTGYDWGTKYKKTKPLTIERLRNMSLSQLESACMWDGDEVAAVIHAHFHPKKGLKNANK